MIEVTFVQTMSRYNRWQNQSIYAAADTLGDETRKADRGAFFKSIHGTLSHLLWADMMWMHRFAGTPKPDVPIGGSAAFVGDWTMLHNRRIAFDETIVTWAKNIDPDWLGGEISWWSGAVNRQMSKPIAGLVVHFFNHQTHHRGQAHAMLTAAGARPDDTDLMLLPED